MKNEKPAVRSVALGIDTTLGRDFDAYAELLAEEFRVEDHRSVQRSPHGKRESVENARVVMELGLEQIDTEVLDTRGDRSALFRQTWRGAGFEVALLQAVTVDDDGRWLALALFDEDDLEAARSELETQAAQS